jgi:hypothetical protein
VAAYRLERGVEACRSSNQVHSAAVGKGTSAATTEKVWDNASDQLGGCLDHAAAGAAALLQPEDVPRDVVELMSPAESVRLVGADRVSPSSEAAADAEARGEPAAPADVLLADG